VTPELAERLAKLLRLLCGGGPDGEVLAAANRISATVASHDVDWDQALANGSGSALTEAQMHRIYSEGYQRGHADGQQATRPARDWTPADNTKAAAGEDAGRIRTILEAAGKSAADGLLTEWEVTFSESIRERFRQYGSRMYVSEKQWSALDRLEEKLRRQDFLE
jgi:hypothetical protein